MTHPYLSFSNTQTQALVAALVPAAWLLLLYCRVTRAGATTYDAKATDPPLLQRNSRLRSFTTSRCTYPAVRIFYRRHPQASRLPQLPAPLPLLVFVHGLGGSVAQFHSLLHSLTSAASCLAIDLPGCGLSDFAPRDWDAYTTDALVELLHVIIEQYRDVATGQPVVLIGHSMGCSLAALLANPVRTARCAVTGGRPSLLLSQHVAALVAICPSVGLTEEQTAGLRKLLWIPDPIFDLWRAWDRRGGLESPSVRRYIGEAADAESKRLQSLFNHQSRTPVWRRMASGMLPTNEAGSSVGKARGGLPAAEEVWAGLAIPVFLVSGASDHITPPAAAEKILACLQRGNQPGANSMTSSQPVAPSLSILSSTTQGPEYGSDHPSHGPRPLVSTVESGGTDQAMCTESSFASDGLLSPPRPLAKTISDIQDEHFVRPGTPRDTDDQLSEGPFTPNDRLPAVPPQPLHPDKYCEHTMLPEPASHALLYTPRTVRVLAGLISDFLTTRVTGRLSLGWQLQYLSQDGKWDVKNLEKWKKVVPMSEPVIAEAYAPTAASPKKVVPGPFTFRVMKTFREVDETHCPREFARSWGGVVKDVIDISHDMPVYDPRGLEQGGIQYHKFPTLSKVPPTNTEIEGFIDLVDDVRAEQYKRAEQDGRAQTDYAIGVHCHYGFNRSGFFVCCYLVERCGLTAQEAIDLFAEKRPKGIKHPHFKDRLCLRYSGVRGEAS